MSTMRLRSKRLELTGNTTKHKTPLKKPTIERSVDVTPIGNNSQYGKGIPKQSISAVRRLDELSQDEEITTSVNESNKENMEMDIEDILSDSSDSINTSDEDEDTRMEKYMKRKNRIMETKQAMLKKLAIVESTKEIRNAMIREKQITKTEKSATKQRAGILKKEGGKPLVESNIQRKSLRLLRKDPRGVDLPPEPVEIERDPRKPGTEFPMVAVDFEEIGINSQDSSEDEDTKFLKKSYTEYERFMKGIKRLNDIFESPAKIDLDRYKKSLKSLKIKPKYVQKVAKGRVFSIAIHPSCTETLVAVGDKYGNLGLWNPDLNDSNNGTYMFQPHINPISCLKFSETNSKKLYSCSYDGQLRCMDLEKSVFEKAFINDEYWEMSGLDFLEPDHTIIVSRSDGNLSIVDTRTDPSNVQTFEAHDRAAKCVSCHPLQKYYVSTSHRDGSVFIFDIRNISDMKCKPVVTIQDHARSVSSAYFSPISGKHLLTTSYDDRLRVFNTSIISQNAVELKGKCFHNNNTGRWLSSFRAAWHPASDDVFVVGSMDRPRKIDIYDSSANYVFEVSDPELLGTVCSINCFHKTRNIIAGGNSSGKIYLFSDNL
uniref:WD repeat-containing protein 76-like n=1 Tax=Styela clava TaxID=7725 RepID=UPI00193AA4D4|nr:WD repeat-containing protein 76-like [Styela clava]